ncbi:unnamed protein product [Gordionus sp. m RMFG-2023]
MTSSTSIIYMPHFVDENNLLNVNKTPPHIIYEEDIISPNANLKMLVSVMSPEIKSKRVENEIDYYYDKENILLNENSYISNNDNSSNLFCIRSSKSLNILCQKFLALYPDYPKDIKYIIQLDQVASQLKVERRRIYDIMNILESLEMATKLGKNKYDWHGRTFLLNCLLRLKKHAESCGILNQDAKIDKVKNEISTKVYDMNEGKGKIFGLYRLSLGILSQKFLMALLISDTKMIFMDQMAKIIDEDEIFNESLESEIKKPKTRVRRLYDIANVLSSLKLVEKIRIRINDGTKKPAFIYVGPDLGIINVDLPTKNVESHPYNIVIYNSPIKTRHSIFKHASFSSVTPKFSDDDKTDQKLYKTPILRKNLSFNVSENNVYKFKNNFNHTPPSAASTPKNILQKMHLNDNHIFNINKTCLSTLNSYDKDKIENSLFVSPIIKYESTFNTDSGLYDTSTTSLNSMNMDKSSTNAFQLNFNEEIVKKNLISPIYFDKNKCLNDDVKHILEPDNIINNAPSASKKSKIDTYIQKLAQKRLNEPLSIGANNFYEIKSLKDDKSTQTNFAPYFVIDNNFLNVFNMSSKCAVLEENSNDSFSGSCINTNENRLPLAIKKGNGIDTIKPNILNKNRSHTLLKNITSTLNLPSKSPTILSTQNLENKLRRIFNKNGDCNKENYNLSSKSSFMSKSFSGLTEKSNDLLFLKKADLAEQSNNFLN